MSDGCQRVAEFKTKIKWHNYVLVEVLSPVDYTKTLLEIGFC